LVLANENDDAKVRGENVKDEKRTEHRPPGEQIIRGFGDEFDGEKE